MNGKQRRHLRAIGHSLKPSLNLGKHGLSEQMKKEIISQLSDHELIKLKVLDTCPLSQKECAEMLSNEKLIEVVQIIGKTLLLFCKNEESQKK